MKILLNTLVLALLTSGCATNPVTGKSELYFVSENQEISVGEENYSMMQQAEGGDYTADKSITTYVQCVGNRLAAVSDRPHLPYEFVVLNNSVPNAWALPGGKIAINRGLLTELDNEAELAAVLSHEIVHSAARHGAQNMERAVLMGAGLLGLQQILKDHRYEDVALGSAALGAGMLSLKYSREAELEADAYGIKYMAAAGYNPYAAVSLQEKFLRLSENSNPSWLEGLFSTHPPSQERLEQNMQTARAYIREFGEGTLGKEEYKVAMEELKRTQPAYDDLDEGYKALMEGDYSKARALAQSGIAIAPKEAHLYNLQGKAEAALGLYQDALISFDHAIALNSNYFDYYLQRGLLYRRLGNETAAYNDLAKSNALLPSADAEYALGMIELRQGRRGAGLSHLETAALADSTAGAEARQELSQFQKIPIKTTVSRSSHGQIELTLINKGTVAYKNLIVQITLSDSRGNILGKHTFRVKETLQPGEELSTLISLPIAPLMQGCVIDAE